MKQNTDRSVGLGLIVLAALVLWSARGFPNVPGQKLGAAFLPMLIGVGLLLCGVALTLRRRVRPAGPVGPGVAASSGDEHFGSSGVTIAAVVIYIVAADTVGFLLLAPLVLLATFLAQRVRFGTALGWSLGGTLLVHVAFYKLLRVPLPWGVLTPFY